MQRLDLTSENRYFHVRASLSRSKSTSGYRVATTPKHSYGSFYLVAY
jgi:hypothetical protein